MESANCLLPNQAMGTCEASQENKKPDPLRIVGLNWQLAGASSLIILCLFLFFFRLGDRDLWSSHEGRAAQDAQSLLIDDLWGMPHLFDGQVEMQKPPLYYWLVASSAKLRGGVVDACDVRLPAALSGLGVIAGFVWFGSKRGRPLAGLLGAGTLATMQHFTSLARTGRIDMPLTLFVGVALGAFYLGWCRRKQLGCQWTLWYYLLAYVAVAAALLLKGPIGIILPAAVVGLWLTLEGAIPAPWRMRAWFRLIHDLGMWWGIPLILALAVPWFAWANFQTGGQFLRIFFGHHNLERALGSGGLRDYPWWYYGPLMMLGMLPWTLMLPSAIWYLWRQKIWQKDLEVRFGLIWLAAMAVVLSCAGFKRIDYLLPAFPGAALFLGAVGERFLQRSPFPRRLALASCLTVAGCVAGWTAYLEYFLPREMPRREDQTFATVIRNLAPAPQEVVFFQVEAHALAFHLGEPLSTIIRWEDLESRVSRSQPIFVVMRPESVREWPKFLKSAQLTEVLRNTDLSGGKHDHPLVLMCSQPRTIPLAP